MGGIPETFEFHLSIHRGNRNFANFKTCLDPATALQLQREHEDNSLLSAGWFMAIMERDFGKDFSTQAREEWRSVVLPGIGMVFPRSGRRNASGD